jgi:hypothetical protein
MITDTAKQAWADEVARMIAERNDYRARAKACRKEATPELRWRDPLRWLSLRGSARDFDDYAKARQEALVVARQRCS